MDAVYLELKGAIEEAYDKCRGCPTAESKIETMLKIHKKMYNPDDFSGLNNFMLLRKKEEYLNSVYHMFSTTAADYFDD